MTFRCTATNFGSTSSPRRTISTHLRAVANGIVNDVPSPGWRNTKRRFVSHTMAQMAKAGIHVDRAQVKQCFERLMQLEVDMLRGTVVQEPVTSIATPELQQFDIAV